jgi:hypothetical protein
MNWMSDKIDKIAPALLKAQVAMKGAKKDKVNPHLKNAYADLASVFEACKEPLNNEGIVIIQTMGVKDDRNALGTVLMHESGQWISANALLPAIDQKGINAAQAMGSAISYMRRYQLSAMAGVLQEDDDGNAAGEKAEPPITCQELMSKITDAKAIPHLANLWKKYEQDMGRMTEQERKDLAVMKDSKKAALQAAKDAERGEG